MPSGVANRATFVVDLDGKIQHIEEKTPRSILLVPKRLVAV